MTAFYFEISYPIYCAIVCDVSRALKGTEAVSILIKGSHVGVFNDHSIQLWQVVCWYSFHTQEDVHILLVPVSRSITYTLLISILNVRTELSVIKIAA